MLIALLVLAAIGAGDVAAPTPSLPCVPVAQLRDLETGTQQLIDQLQKQLENQRGVLDALRYLIRVSEYPPVPAPTAARAR